MPVLLAMISVNIILTGWICREFPLGITNLRGAKLCNARLQGVDFAGANLTGADLTGAYLTGAKITKAQVASAVVDENTRLPFFSTDDSSEPPAKHSP